MGDFIKQVCCYDPNELCQYCGRCEDDDNEYDEGTLDDIFFSSGYCDMEDCICQGPHFASECHTAKDLEEYYKALEKENKWQ